MVWTEPIAAVQSTTPDATRPMRIEHLRSVHRFSGIEAHGSVHATWLRDVRIFPVYNKH